MTNRKRCLTAEDHQILLQLIRGITVEDAGKALGLNRQTTTTRLNRMRILTECQATYQLVALEAINLMESNAELPELPVLGMAASA